MQWLPQKFTYLTAVRTHIRLDVGCCVQLLRTLVTENKDTSKEIACGGQIIRKSVSLKTLKERDRGRCRLTCPNHGRLAHGERHGHQGKGWEIHAPWSPFLPEGTGSSIHCVAVICQPAWALGVGCAGRYPLTESQPKRGTRLNLLRGNGQKGTPLETSLPLSRRLSWMGYLLVHKTRTLKGVLWG